MLGQTKSLIIMIPKLAVFMKKNLNFQNIRVHLSVSSRLRAKCNIRILVFAWVRAPTKAPVVSLSKKLYPYCLVLLERRNRF